MSHLYATDEEKFFHQVFTEYELQRGDLKKLVLPATFNFSYHEFTFSITEGINRFVVYFDGRIREVPTLLDAAKWCYTRIERVMYITDIMKLIINPAIGSMGYHSKDLIVLLGGTIVANSQPCAWHNLKEKGIGLYKFRGSQIEKVKRYLNKPENRELLICVLHNNCINHIPENDALLYNLRYATMMAALVYKTQIQGRIRYQTASDLTEYYRTYFNPRLKAEYYEVIDEVFKRVIRAAYSP